MIQINREADNQLKKGPEFLDRAKIIHTLIEGGAFLRGASCRDSMHLIIMAEDWFVLED